MALNEDDFKAKLDSLKLEDWKPLLDLIPEIEATGRFGKIVNPPKTKNDVSHLPFWSSSPIVSKFCEVAYEIPIVLNFDWVAWDEARKMAGEKNFDYDNVDVMTKCKMITAIMRSDRFNDGELIDAFESGLILKLLKSIAQQVK